MLDLALIGDSHRLKPTVRMRPDAERLFARGKIVQGIVIEQKERAHPLTRQRPVREKPVYVESIADPMLRRRCNDLLERFDRSRSFCLCFHMYPYSMRYIGTEL